VRPPRVGRRGGGAVGVSGAAFRSSSPAEAATAAPADTSSSFVITPVTVIDVQGGSRLRDYSVVVAGNRIRAVGPANRIHPSAGGRRVDGRHGYLIPRPLGLQPALPKDPATPPTAPPPP